MRRFPLNAGASATSNGGIIIAPPPIVPAAPPADCPPCDSVGQVLVPIGDVALSITPDPVAGHGGEYDGEFIIHDTTDHYGSWLIDMGAIDYALLCKLHPTTGVDFSGLPNLVVAGQSVPTSGSNPDIYLAFTPAGNILVSYYTNLTPGDPVDPGIEIRFQIYVGKL